MSLSMKLIDKRRIPNVWLFPKIKKTSLPGIEPGIFKSVVRRVIHCATRPHGERMNVKLVFV